MAFSLAFNRDILSILCGIFCYCVSQAFVAITNSVYHDSYLQVALFLMDTQGLADSKFAQEPMEKLFAFSSLLSSPLIYNGQSQINVDNFKNFKDLIAFGNVFQEEGGSYQSLVVLVRDWQLSSNFGFEGGEQYFEKTFLSEKVEKKHKSLAEEVEKSFKEIKVFTMTSPSDTIKSKTQENQETKYYVKDIGEKFLAQVSELEKEIVENIKPEALQGGYASGVEMIELAIRCANRINENNDVSIENKQISPALFVQRNNKESLQRTRSAAHDVFEKAGLPQTPYVDEMRQLLEKRLNNFDQEWNLSLERKNEKQLEKEAAECFLKYKAGMDELLTDKHVNNLDECHNLFKKLLYVKLPAERLMSGTAHLKKSSNALDEMIEKEYKEIYLPRNELHEKIYKREYDLSMATIIFTRIIMAPLAVIVTIIAIPFGLLCLAAYGFWTILEGIEKAIRNKKHFSYILILLTILTNTLLCLRVKIFLIKKLNFFDLLFAITLLAFRFDEPCKTVETKMLLSVIQTFFFQLVIFGTNNTFM